MMRRLALMALALSAVTLGARAHVGSHEIAVRDGYFEPQELRIDPGETVTWNALAQGHTITADDGRFDFPGDRLTRQGDRFQWTFPTDETFFFHCKVHGSMFGIVVVGGGTPPAPPSEDPPEIRRVPQEFPTITDAIVDASPDTVIEIAPRSYVESVVVDVPGIVLRGTGASPSDVRIEGGSVRGVGVTIAAPRVRIEQLTIRRTTFAGIFVNGAARATITDVVLEANDQYGIRMVGVRGAVLRRVAASGSARAGISLASCAACDTVIDGALLERNMSGVAVTNAAGVVIRGSTIRGNGTGISIKSVLTGEETAQRGAHIYGNTIEDNTFLPGTRPSVSRELEIPTATGILLSGSTQTTVSANVIRGHLYGIAVASLTAPSVGVRIAGNQLSTSSAADLAWDGAGLAVCFEGNAGGGGGEPATDPPGLTLTAACRPIPTVGVPYPVVTARILAHAA